MSEQPVPPAPKLAPVLEMRQIAKRFGATQPLVVSSPHEAQAHGIVAIYQEPMMFPDLNVAENIFIIHAHNGLLVNWNQRLSRGRSDPGHVRCEA